MRQANWHKIGGESPLKRRTNHPRFSCAVERRFLLAGAKPVRQLSLQPVAIGAVQGGNELD